MHQFFIILFREFLRPLRTWAFWIPIILLPIIYTIIIGVSIFSQKETQKETQKNIENISAIFIYDASGLIQQAHDNNKIQILGSYAGAKEAFLATPNSLLVSYPHDFEQSKKITILADTKEVFPKYDDLITYITKQNISDNIDPKNLLTLYSAPYTFSVEKYQDGQPIENSEKKIVAAMMGVAFYFLMVIFGTSRMLTSMIEEKESRMMEIVLSTVRPRTFISGKIFGGFLLTIVQIIILFGIPLILVLNVPLGLPFDVGAYIGKMSFLQLLFTFFSVFVGFLTLAALMVGVGAATTNAKEAGNMAAGFILVSIIPVYIVSLVIASPQGVIPMVLSYFPITSPFFLLMRSGLEGLYWWEYVLGPTIVLMYMFISFWIAKKLFMIGAVEYSKKASWNVLFHKK